MRLFGQCQFVAVLFPCTFSSFLLYKSFFLITWCLLGDIRVLSAFDMLWHFGHFPSMHRFLACASQRKQLVGAPSISTHGDITWWFWDPGIGVLANLKAVSMCFITFTKSSSGLSGCQCCMICIEHVFHPLKEGPLFCFKCVQTVLLALVLCLPQRLLCDLLWPSVDACHSKGMTRVFFSNAHKHPVITVVMFTL